MPDFTLKITFPAEAFKNNNERLHFELRLMEVCKKFDWSWMGQGQEIKTGTRDITFVKRSGG